MPMKNMNRQTRFHVGYWIAAVLGLLALQYFYTTAQKVAASTALPEPRLA